MDDLTESRRRILVDEINSKEFQAPPERWTADEARERFEFIGFMAPFAIARERATGREGTLEFTHSPRFYFNWEANR